MTCHIHLTPLGGMAGDMFAAALLDAFPELAPQVFAATAAVLPGANAVLAPCTRAGLAARHFSVPDQRRTAPMHYPAMDGLLHRAALPEAVRTTARALLRLLAGAESNVHGVLLEQVHFHEIADWDTLADMAAAAALFAALDGATWSIDPLPLGGGTVQTAHGRLPVPAPATAHLLRGLPVHDDGITGERVTPTGAAIARHILTRLPLRPRPMGRMQATGHGAGTRDPAGVANILVAQVIAPPVQQGDSVTILEWQIDDMTGEEIAIASDHLRACGGVLDLLTFQTSGKKGRAMTAFRLIARPGHGDAIAGQVFDQTSTLGLRLREERRLILPRAPVSGGKTAMRPHGPTTKAESDLLAPLPTLAERRAKAREAEG